MMRCEKEMSVRHDFLQFILRLPEPGRSPDLQITRHFESPRLKRVPYQWHRPTDGPRSFSLYRRTAWRLCDTIYRHPGGDGYPQAHALVNQLAANTGFGGETARPDHRNRRAIDESAQTKLHDAQMSPLLKETHLFTSNAFIDHPR